MTPIPKSQALRGPILSWWRRWRVQVENLVRVVLAVWLVYSGFAYEFVVGYTFVALMILASVRLGKDTLFRRLVHCCKRLWGRKERETRT